MVQAFLETVFPETISRGSIGGPMWQTEIAEKASGAEERNSPWSRMRHRYDAKFGIRLPHEIETVRGFFVVVRGRLTAFRFKDWGDYRSCRTDRAVRPTDQTLGLGNGVATAFALTKTYVLAGSSYVRPIQKPRREGFRVALGGRELFQGWTLDPATGILSFAAAPAASDGHIQWGGEFDVPVRFDTDALDVDYHGPIEGIPSIPLIEVRL